MVEIIPVKKGRPIFILKDLLNFDKQFAFVNKKIVIYKGKFIWKNKIKVSPSRATMLFLGKGDSIGSYIDEYETYDDYPNRIKNRCPSKEYSIQNILDTEIKSDKKYIKPLRDLLRKYNILKDRRGVGEKKHKYRKLIQERIKFVNKAYREVIRAKKQKTPIPIKSIQRKLEDYAGKRTYSDDPKEAEREKRIFNVNDVTIRRDIQNYMEK